MARQAYLRGTGEPTTLTEKKEEEVLQYGRGLPHSALTTRVQRATRSRSAAARRGRVPAMITGIFGHDRRCVAGRQFCLDVGFGDILLVRWHRWRSCTC